MKKDFRSINDVTREEFLSLIEDAKEMKEGIRSGKGHPKYLEGQTLAMIFQKPSLRTRVSFETGFYQLGGHALYLGPNDIKMGGRESVADIAHNLERFNNGIMARVFENKHIQELGDNASIPVINALCDEEHPCQILADLMTVQEHKGELKNLKLTYIGDGNNVANSLALACGLLGMDCAIATPKGYEIPEKYSSQAKKYAEESGGTLLFTHDPIEAITDADAVYTDTWVSMGQEDEREKRIRDFEGYLVDNELASHAKDDYIFLHCLPAYRGYEVADEVIDGPHSVVFDEAENRLHAQKAVMKRLMMK